MPDGVVLNAGTAGVTATTDDCGAAGHTQVVKLAISADGNATLIPADATNGIDVDVTRTVTPQNGTATGSHTATGSTAIAANGRGSVGVQITGTWVATVQFEATIDGTNWFSVPAFPPTTGVSVTSTSANGQWIIPSAGYEQVRARVSAFTSGTVVIDLEASQNTQGITIVNAAGLATSAKQDTIIGHVDGIEALLTTIDADTNSLAVVGGGTEATAQRVTIASDSTGVLSVDDNGGSLTVDNSTLAVVGGGVESGTLRVTIANDSTGLVSVDDNGGTLSVDDGAGSLTVDGSVSITGAVDTELPAAAALSDAAANPTTPSVGAALLEFNGTTWDRVRGDTTNGLDVDVTRVSGTVTVDSELPAAAALADATANPTTPLTGAALEIFNGTTWDRARGDITNGIDVDVTRVSGNVTVVQSTASSLKSEVVGPAAHDVAAAGNPVLLAGIAQDMDDVAAPPNRVNAEADAVRLATDRDGALFVRPFGPQVWSYHANGSAALSAATVHAAPGAGLSLYVTDIICSLGAATAMNILFQEGASTVLGPFYLEAINGRGLHIQFQTPKKITANTALTVTTSAAVAHSVDVTGFTAQG